MKVKHLWMLFTIGVLLLSNSFLSNAASVGKVYQMKPINTSKGIEVSWNKEDGADGYEVYRVIGMATSSADDIVEDICAEELESGLEAEWIDAKAKEGQTYTYNIRAYQMEDNKKDYGAFSTSRSIFCLGKSDRVSVKNIDDGIKLSWEKVQYADGYDICRVVGTKTPWGTNCVASVKGTTWIDDLAWGEKDILIVCVLMFM